MVAVARLGGLLPRGARCGSPAAGGLMMSNNMSMPRGLALQGPSNMSKMMMTQNQKPHTDIETAPKNAKAQMVSSDLAPGSGAKVSLYPVSNQKLRQAEQHEKIQAVRLEM